MTIRLTTLGQLALADTGTGRPLAVQRKALALLAILAAEQRPVARDRLLALLWADGGEPARGALKQTVYQLRKSLDSQDVILGSSELALDTTLVTTDVSDIEAAASARNWDGVIELYRGPFLDGLTVRGTADFEHWIDVRRARYASLFHDALERAATAATSRGDSRAAAQLWRRLAAEDPLSGRYASGLVTALTAEGEIGAALTHYADYERRMREELDAGPDPVVVAAIERIRASAGSSPPASLMPRQATEQPDGSRGVPDDAVPPASRAPAPTGRRSHRMWFAAALLLVLVATSATAWRARGAPRVIASVDLPARSATRLNFDPVLDRIYVDGGANFETELAVIDAASLRIITVPGGAGAIVDPLTHWYWTGNYGERYVALRNGRTDSVLSRIPVPGCPHGFALDGPWLWVAQQCDDHISVIDRRTSRVVRHIPIATLSRAEVGGAKGMGEIVINPATRIVYFWKDMLPHRLDPATWASRETPAFGGYVIAVNPSMNRLYVRVHFGLRVLDGATEQAIADVRLPSAPWSVTVGFAGARLHAVTSHGVVVLDGRSNDVERVLRFRDGYQPHSMAVDEKRSRAYVIGTLPTGRRVLRVLALDG